MPATVRAPQRRLRRLPGPEILIALAARATERIRVGSGAVLLNHSSPFKVAETRPSSSSKPLPRAGSTSVSAAPPRVR
ncbi:hypothetical protein [Streptomyces sp. NL15-2K]|uniref:hypothetical protein n=1 Tax=Streptomyces sp. NL15-2K TaxID=376149 RepID=UPI001C0F0343|nr:MULTISPECIES: hypothetical protein [Actinomycetes]WKX06220.1 hypothetical protein Q4V64_01445 [Kutzneria buriramensis]